MVFCTGGMSVDPDDKTPLAIRNTGARVISYGAPVLPGAMFLVSYMEDGRPVCGLPGCVMYAKRPIFDLALPRLLADEPPPGEWLAGGGSGGRSGVPVVATVSGTTLRNGARSGREHR